MSDMSEYAKRKSEDKYPHIEDRAETAANAVRTTLRQGSEWGILHLAARLAEDDVIEAGMDSLADDGLDWDDANRVREVGPFFDSAQRAIASMLAKIAEVPDDNS